MEAASPIKGQQIAKKMIKSSIPWDTYLSVDEKALNPGNGSLIQNEKCIECKVPKKHHIQKGRRVGNFFRVIAQQGMYCMSVRAFGGVNLVCI